MLKVEIQLSGLSTEKCHHLHSFPKSFYIDLVLVSIS